MEHDAFHVPYLLDTTPEAAFHGQAVKTVAYLRVSTTQQVLGPEARTPEGLAGRLTARWQGGRNPALPRTGRFQDRHRQVWACPVPPSTAHEHPRAQAEPLACISTRILSVPSRQQPQEKQARLQKGAPRRLKKRAFDETLSQGPVSGPKPDRNRPVLLSHKTVYHTAIYGNQKEDGSTQPGPN